VEKAVLAACFSRRVACRHALEILPDLGIRVPPTRFIKAKISPVCNGGWRKTLEFSQSPKYLQTASI
jgi:hypothetical protein